MEYIELRKQRDFSAVISTGFQFVRQNWKTLYRPLVFICLPPYLVASFFFGNFFRTVYTGTLGGTTGTIGTAAGSMFLGYALMFLSMLLLYAMIYEFMRHYAENHGLAPTTGELWKASARQLPAYFVIALLAGMIAMAGILLLIFGALWLAIVFTMAFPLRSFEKAGIGESIGGSFKLIKGHWWETFGLVLVLTLLISFLGYVIYLPFLLFTGFGAMSGMEGMDNPGEFGERMGWVMTVFMLVAGLVSVLLQPLLQVPLGLQALSLMEEKQGRGLLQRVDQMSASPIA
jgi:hypothetical protein